MLIKETFTEQIKLVTGKTGVLSQQMMVIQSP